MSEHPYDHTYTDYQSRRGFLRKLVRGMYLQSARRQLTGKTLDFGCGIGELLARLAPGSKGLEYNKATVDYCRARGLDVSYYDGVADDWRLSPISHEHGLESMVVSHVLEHLDRPMVVLNQLLLAAMRLGISRVLVIVPGRAGYASDNTHVTFVDAGMLLNDAVTAGTRFAPLDARYFPGNLRIVGNWFRHHELQVVFQANR